MSTDTQLRLELAREAKALLDERAFTTAIKTLRQQWFGELMLDGVEGEKMHELVCKLRALEGIPTALAHLIADEKFAQRVPQNVR